ncbi:MAG: Na+/H+ antiporter subunit E [Thiolinea sp.]
MSLYLRILTIGLASFWLLLSGFWDKPLLLILGAISVVFSAYLALRIERVYSLHSVTKIIFRVPLYSLWLSWEMVKTTIDVVKCIWMPKRYPISPALNKVPMTQKTRLGKTIYANSITFTPGTVSVRLEQGEELLVHALTADGMDDLKAGGMDARVTDLEK